MSDIQILIAIQALQLLVLAGRLHFDRKRDQRERLREEADARATMRRLARIIRRLQGQAR